MKLVARKRSSNKHPLCERDDPLLHPSRKLLSQAILLTRTGVTKKKKMVCFGRHYPRIGCNMQFLVPLYSVVSCKQLIHWCFSCLPSNRRKWCWKKISIQSDDSNGRHGGTLPQRKTRLSECPATSFWFLKLEGRNVNEVQKNKWRLYISKRQNAANQHISCILWVSASSISKILMSNLLKYLILFQDISICVSLSWKLKGPGGCYLLQITVRIP